MGAWVPGCVMGLLPSDGHPNSQRQSRGSDLILSGAAVTGATTGWTALGTHCLDLRSDFLTVICTEHFPSDARASLEEAKATSIRHHGWLPEPSHKPGAYG